MRSTATLLILVLLFGGMSAVAPADPADPSAIGSLTGTPEDV